MHMEILLNGILTKNCKPPYLFKESMKRMKHLCFLLIALMIMITSCQNKTVEEQNPFFVEYSTEFNAPPFDLIKESHYLPAFKKGVEEQEKEIEAIVKNTHAPDFNNTIVAFDKSGELLTKVGSVFYNIKETDNND